MITFVLIVEKDFCTGNITERAAGNGRGLFVRGVGVVGEGPDVRGGVGSFVADSGFGLVGEDEVW
jgi:hypothetical protein